MKILIIGISNFIGFNLGNDLVKQFEVVGTISKNFNQYHDIKEIRIKKLSKKIRLIKLNIHNKNKIEDIFKIENPDIVINASGYTKDYTNNSFNRERGYKINVLPLNKIIKALSKNKIKKSLFFHIGSSWEYSQNIKICKENSNKLPRIPYGRQKLNATKLLKSIINKDTKIVVLRIFNIFGPLDNNEKFFPYLLSNLKKNKVSKLSSCTQMRDYISTNDLAKSVIKIIKIKRRLKNFEIFNICRGRPLLLKMLATKICALLGKEKKLLKFDKKNDRDFESKILFGSNEKIMRLTKWRPSKLNESLKLLTNKTF